MKGARRLISETWDLLKRPTSGHEHSARVLEDYEVPLGPVLLAWDSDGTRHVLVPISPDEVVKPDRSSQGVQLALTEFVDAGNRRTFVDIRCPKPSLYRVFDQIAANMLEEVRGSDRPAPLICRTILAQWRQLLQRAQQPISMSVLRGAFAELVELRRLAELDVAAVDYWTGPSGQSQDFVSSRGAIEVKAISSGAARRVCIHGFDQLHAEPHGFLLLMVRSAPLDPKGESLVEVVQHLERLGVDSEALRDGLSLIGLCDLDDPEVRNARFGAGAEWGYLVGPDFPRLSPAQLAAPLAPAVDAVDYELILAKLEQQPLSSTALDSCRRQFLGRE